eukprot:UN04348
MKKSTYRINMNSSFVDSQLSQTVSRIAKSNQHLRLEKLESEVLGLFTTDKQKRGRKNHKEVQTK